MKKQLHIELPALQADLQAYIHKVQKQLILSENIIQITARDGLEHPYAFAYAIDDTATINTIKKTIAEKKKLNPAMLIVIGIGGSNLGTMAVQEALLGSLYNDTNPDLKIYYADTVDTDYLQSILSLAESTLKAGKNILLNLISKSGKTTESVANFELFLALLKKHRPENYSKMIVCTTDKDSSLWKLAVTQQFTTLEIPAQIGGRYSVFTAVGLFPLGMIGIDIDNLLEGARAMRTLCLQKEDNPATQSAAWFFALLHKGYSVANLFLFSNELRSCGAWWRQLVGESLGKAQTRSGTPNNLPIVPTISIGTTDLHSVGQLYFADITKIITQFVVIEKDRSSLTLPDYKEYDALVPHIQNKSISHIMHAIVAGVQKAYAEKKMPFCTVTLPEKNAYYIGQFLIYKMFEAIYLAQLLDVNAFDQPEVELYKKEVRAILAQE